MVEAMFFQFKDATTNKKYNLLDYIFSCLIPVPILSFIPLILLSSSLGRLITIISIGLISLFFGSIIFAARNQYTEMIGSGSDIEFDEIDPKIPRWVSLLSIILVSLSCLILYIFF